MRAAFVHVQHGDTWRVFEALLLEHKEDSRRLRPKWARLIYLDSANRINFIEAESFKDRCSAVYYVLAKDFHLMEKDIRDDFAARELWRESLEDVNRLTPAQSPPTR